MEFVDAYDAGQAQRSMNRRIFGGKEITVVVASESRKRPEEMRVKTRTRSRSVSVFLIALAKKLSLFISARS